MMQIEDLKRPTKQEQILAKSSHIMLQSMLERLNSESAEIEIQETKQRVIVPRSVLELMVRILEATSQGKPISIVPVAMELTTQAAAEMLGCSRPHLVKILTSGEIPFTMVGRHRRVKYEDILNYKRNHQALREKLLIEIMKGDEELGLYDT